MKIYKTGIYKVRADKSGMKVVCGKEGVKIEYPDYLRDESNSTGSDVEMLFFPRTIENVSYVVQEALDKGKTVTISGGRTGICAGAVPDGGWLLSLEKMDRVLDIDRCSEEYELKVESGIRLSELSGKIKSKELGLKGEAYKEFMNSKKSYFYPPDPTETSAMLGGTVATNASGAQTFYYGATRDYVVGVELILPTGELLRIRRGDIREKEGCFEVQKEQGGFLKIPAPHYKIPKTKHSAGLYSQKGMDLIDLFIGSEGILGIIVNATLRLIEEPSSRMGGVAFFKSEEHSLDFVLNARKMKAKPLALEYFDRGSLLLLEETKKRQGPTSEIPEIPNSSGDVYAVYFEISWKEEDDLKARVFQWISAVKESHGNSSLTWGALNKRDLLRLKIFRHALPETVNMLISQNKLEDSRIHKVGTDMAVPDEYLKEMAAYYRNLLNQECLRHVVFGHVGNNHLHVNMIPSTYEELQRSKEIYSSFAKKAVSLGGTVSAEHGIGKLKKEYLLIQYPKEAIDEMKSIKYALDPKGIVNPGNMI